MNWFKFVKRSMRKRACVVVLIFDFRSATKLQSWYKSTSLSFEHDFA